jgi:hypothetical protein
MIMRRVALRCGMMRTLLFAAPFAALTAPAFAQANPNHSLETDQNNVGGPGGARLDAQGELIIAAPVATPLNGNPADPNHPVCYTIQNKTNNSYFVPWRTAREWSAFLDAIGAPYQLSNMPYTGPTWPAPGGWVSAEISNSCCAPQTIGHICPDGSGPVSTTQLGYRYEGTITGDPPYWGAQGDVYGPVYASVINGDPNQTYRVTFVCSDGNWIQTHAEGSCLPVAGQCNRSHRVARFAAKLRTSVKFGLLFGIVRADQHFRRLYQSRRRQRRQRLDMELSWNARLSGRRLHGQHGGGRSMRRRGGCACGMGKWLDPSEYRRAALREGNHAVRRYRSRSECLEQSRHHLCP